MKKTALERQLWQFLEHTPEFKTSLALTRKVSTGKIWLIGSGVYKNLLRIISGTIVPIDDYDFIVERLHSPLPKLAGWSISKNSFGNFRFTRGSLVVDPIPLGNIHSVNAWGWKPTISNYMRQVGFSVQAIAFDIANRRLIGDKAIRDIAAKKIRINNQRNYVWTLEKYGEKVSLAAISKKLRLKPIPS